MEISKTWYILRDGHQEGPYSSKEMASKIQEGKLKNDQYIWKDGQKDWEQVSRHYQEYFRPYIETVCVEEQRKKHEVFKDLPRSEIMRLFAYGKKTDQMKMPQTITGELSNLKAKEKKEDVSKKSYTPLSNEDIERLQDDLANASVVTSDDDAPPPLPFIIQKSTSQNSLPPLPNPLNESKQEKAVFNLDSTDTINIKTENNENDVIVDSSNDSMMVELSFDEKMNEVSTENIFSKNRDSNFAFKQSAKFLKLEKEKRQALTKRENILRTEESDYDRPDLILKRERFYYKLITFLKSPRFYAPMLFICSVVLAFFSYVYFSKGIPSRPSGMSRSDYKRLVEVTKVDPQKYIAIEFAASIDGSKLWMASNFQGKTLMSVMATSIKGKTIGNDQVVITSEATYNRQIVEFSKFNIIEGKGHVSGHYKAKISSVERLMPQNIIEKIQSKFSEVDWGGIKKLNQEKIIYWPKKGLTKEQFRQNLKKFNNNLNSKKVAHLEDLIQYYTTLIQYHSQIEHLLKNVLKSVKVGDDVMRFERSYHVQVGKMLGPMAFEVDKMLTELKEQKDPLSEDYKEFKTFSIELGEFVADFVTEMKSKGELLPSDIEEIRLKYSTTLRELEVAFRNEREKHSRFLKRYKLGN